MKAALALTLLLSIGTALSGLALLRSESARQRYFAAQRGVLDAAAKSKDAELRQAIGVAQDAEKTLLVNQGLGRGLVWVSIGSTVLAFIFTFTHRARIEPNPPLATARVRGPSGRS